MALEQIVLVHTAHVQTALVQTEPQLCLEPERFTPTLEKAFSSLVIEIFMIVWIIM